jgi:hypothetical protein
VRRYQSEIDYNQEIAKTFAKFKQGDAKDYRNERFIRSGMNAIEAEILHYVTKLYPEIFTDLDRYCRQYADFVDKGISVFDREVQFYIAYLTMAKSNRQIEILLSASCQIARTFSQEGFDLALAGKCLAENSSIVCNDFCLNDRERILIVSG